MSRRIVTIAFLLGLAVVFSFTGNVNRDRSFSLVSHVYADSCNPRDNMDETAERFIGRCCEASIRNVFPGEYFSKTMNEIQQNCKVGSRRDCDDGDEPSLESARKARTAWKLLNKPECKGKK